jgi:5-methylthioadenosine/S-adenosylhomocysteine deaminase
MELRRKVEAFITEWHRPEGRIQVFLAPSTLFLCDDGLLTWSRDRAEELDLGIQIHISEIAGEVEDSLKEWNRTPVERLVDLGLLTPRLSAVHCVHVNNAEIDCMAKAGVTIVHCPKSNMKLADGIAPVVSMQKAGLRIGLGTDGCGSNDLLDMWEEMRAAVFLARVSTKQADALSAADVFRMATLDAAHTCRIEAGQIRVGCLADLAIVELKSAHLRPFHADRLLDMLVFCGRAGDVRDTIIAGEVVMRNRCITRLAEGDLLQEADVIEAALYADRSEFIF